MADDTLDLVKMLPGDSAFLRHNYLAYASQAMVSLSVAGNANVTLTEAQAAHYQIRFTGVLTGNILVLVPQKEKPYIFVNATTGAFTLTVQPVTSGLGLVLARGMFTPFTCNGVDIIRYGSGMATEPEGIVHTIEADGVISKQIHEHYISSTSGPADYGRKARGTRLSPALVNDDDVVRSYNGEAWGRDAANSANGWVAIGRLRFVVDSKDAQGRLGGRVQVEVSPGVSAAQVPRFAVSQAGEVILGNPTTGTDKITLVTGDRDGVAGKHSLTVITEDGTEHTFGDRLRMTRLPNGQSVDWCVITEVTTIAAAAFTDTTFLIPADARVDAVTIRVQSTIPTATTFAYGVAGATTRYGSGISTTATTRYSGSSDLDRHYPTATAIRITPNLTPAAATGSVRVTVHYKIFIAPDS